LLSIKVVVWQNKRLLLLVRLSFSFTKKDYSSAKVQTQQESKREQERAREEERKGEQQSEDKIERREEETTVE
jgi:hypothetical protein